MATRTKNPTVLKKQKCGGFLFLFFSRNFHTKNECKPILPLTIDKRTKQYNYMETNIFSAFYENENAEKKSDFEGYVFTGITDLFSDKSGNFWYKNKPIKKHYRPYQTYLLIDGKQIGMKTLRKLAVKTNQSFCPF